MNYAINARKLANFIATLDEDIAVHQSTENIGYDHIGALYTDIVLQAGLNYNTVVKPRVQHVLLNYSNFHTVQLFIKVMNDQGLGKIIDWTHAEKLDRFHNIINFSLNNGIDTCSDLKKYLTNTSNHCRLLDIKGVGFKTLDYLLKLLNVDSVAVDRHIYSFVKLANIDVRGYHETKKVVEYAADFLNVSRSSLDKGIWVYMSQKKAVSIKNYQQSFEFSDLGY